MNLRDKVKDLCKLQGITQKELAEKIGIKENTLNISLRKGNPTLATIEKIAGGFNITPSELLQQDNDQPAEKEVTYLRCPHCGKKINLWATAIEDGTIPPQESEQ